MRTSCSCHPQCCHHANIHPVYMLLHANCQPPCQTQMPYHRVRHATPFAIQRPFCHALPILSLMPTTNLRRCIMNCSLTASSFPPPPIVEGIGASSRLLARELVPIPPQAHTRIHAPLPVSVEGATHLQIVLAEAQIPGAVSKAPTTRPGVRTGSNRFFRGAQWHVAAPLVPSVLGAMNTSTPSAQPPSCGMGERHACAGTNKGGSSLWTACPSASASKPQLDVQRPHTQPNTHAQVVASLGTVPSSVLLHRRSNVLTPYHPDAWLSRLMMFNLLERYLTLYHSLIHGFDVGILSISKTYVPPNNLSIFKHLDVYNEIVENKFRKGRYIGPFTQANLKALIGPFQSSPHSLVPKLGKPGKYRAVHDFSHPHLSDKNAISSINSNIDSHDFPCTWGTFSMVCLIIHRLPPGSQASIRDVS